MKYAKMLGLAAAAAFALMAFVGVSGAAASAKICSTTGTGAACASGHGNEYTTQTLTAETTTAAGQQATLTSGFVRVTCDSHLEGEVTHGGSGKITSLTFTNCNANDSGLGSCTASTTASAATPWNATGVASGKNDGNGTMQVSSEVTGQFTCSGITCRYKAANAGTKGEIVVNGGDSTGGTAPTVVATNVPLTKEEVSSGLCSGTANWDGSYTVETPDSLWLT